MPLKYVDLVFATETFLKGSRLIDPVKVYIFKIFQVHFVHKTDTSNLSSHWRC